MLRLHPDVVLTDTDDGAVLLHQGTGEFWQLNRTGGHLLHRLVDGETEADVAADLATRHNVALSTVAADLSTVLDQLLAEKLVLRS